MCASMHAAGPSMCASWRVIKWSKGQDGQSALWNPLTTLHGYGDQQSLLNGYFFHLFAFFFGVDIIFLRDLHLAQSRFQLLFQRLEELRLLR